MKFQKNLVHALVTGAVLATMSSAQEKPNDQLSISADAPIKIQEYFASWKEGERLRGRQDKCYGIALAGGNDCKAGTGTRCEGSPTISCPRTAWTVVPEGRCD